MYLLLPLMMQHKLIEHYGKSNKYTFRRMELEQFAMFEENYNKDIKEVQFQTEVQFSFYKGISVLCCRISVNMSAMDKPLAKIVLKSFFEIHLDSLKLLLKEDKIVFPPVPLVQFASLCYGAIRGVQFSKTKIRHWQVTSYLRFISVT